MKSILRFQDCPDKDKHTECPEDYVAWHQWADEMMKTHTQICCETCGFYTIWIPKIK